MRRGLMAAAAAALAFTTSFTTPVTAQSPRAEKPLEKVRLAVGGQTALYYLPLTVTQRLGYFRDAGLDVEISDFQGGAKSLQALIGGSADVVTGAYDHTIQMHAKGQPIVAVVQLGRIPGFVLAVRGEKGNAYKGPQDLKGMRIGVTAPGSSTHFMVLHLMARHGLKGTDASFVGVGAGASAVAAIRRGEIDALVSVDPVIARLDRDKQIRVVADTRTPEGTQAVYDGPYPAAVLYTTPAFLQKNPAAVQALATAFVRGLKWVQASSPEEIARVMPEEHALGDKEIFVQSIRASKPTYSPDGRFTRAGAETALTVLKAFDESVAKASIDLSTTYTDAFVARAQ